MKFVFWGLFLVLLTSCASSTKPQRHVAFDGDLNNFQVGRILGVPYYVDENSGVLGFGQRSLLTPAMTGAVELFYESQKVGARYRVFIAEHDPKAGDILAAGLPADSGYYSVRVHPQEIEFLQVAQCTFNQKICVGDYVAKKSNASATYVFSARALEKDPVTQKSHGVYQISVIAIDKDHQSLLLSPEGFVTEEMLGGQVYKRQNCEAYKKDFETYIRCRR